MVRNTLGFAGAQADGSGLSGSRSGRRATVAAGRALGAVLLAAALAVPAVLPVVGAPFSAAADEASDGLSADVAPEVSSPAAFLMDIDTGTVLYEKDSDSQRYPASTTKVMTALLVLEHGGLDDTVTMEDVDFEELSSDSSSAGLYIGETLTVRDLLACLLLPSGNEAAYALARYVSGDWGSFVNLMNERASELGCTNTHFANPCGLHDDAHYTSAHDLALIFAEALQHPEFSQISGSATWDLPATNKNAARTLTNTDYLVQPLSAVYMDGVVTAGKTGSTSEAGKCLVASGEKDGMRLVAVALGAGETADARGITDNFYDVETLLDWGIGAWETKDVVSEGDTLGQVAVELSKDGEEVGAVSTGSVLATVPKGTELSDLTVSGSWQDALQAPVEGGQDLGQATLLLGERELGTVGVSASRAMELSIPAFLVWWLSDPVHAAIVVACFALVVTAVGVSTMMGRRRRQRPLSKYGSSYRMAVGQRPQIRPGVGSQRLKMPTARRASLGGSGSRGRGTSGRSGGSGAHFHSSGRRG